MKWTAAFAVFIATLGVCADRAAAQTGVQINTRCSTQNVLGKGATLNIQTQIINCPGEGAQPRTALKVNYYWLDAVSATLLFAGRLDERLSALLGNKPVILVNDVTEAFEDLQKRFGSTIGSHSRFKEVFEFHKTFVQAGRSRQLQQVDLGRYRSNAYAGLRIFDGTSTIYWPDVAAVREMTTTPEFPKGYRHYVSWPDNQIDPPPRAPLNQEQIDRAIFDAFVSRVFYRPVSFAELETYRERLTEMKEAAQAGLQFSEPLDDQIDRMVPPLPGLDEGDDAFEKRKQELIRRLPELGSSKTVAALRYLARDGMPDDFLMAFGILGEHGGIPHDWSLVALPRRLFVQIAVIENAATTPTDYSLPEFVVMKEDATALRKPSTSAPSQRQVMPFPQGRLSHRERVVIPLALEFREHRRLDDETGELKPDDRGFANIKRSLALLPQQDLLLKDGQDEPKPVFPAKPKALFETHAAPVVESTYLYGPRVTIVSAKLQDLDILIRPAQVAGVYRVAGFPGGSCPILYYRTQGSDEWHKVGNVLRNASAASLQERETYDLPGDVAEIALAEEEPERSYIKDVTVIARDRAGNVRSLAASRAPFKLDAEEIWSAPVARAEAGEAVQVSIEGYYVPYSRALQTSRR